MSDLFCRRLVWQPRQTARCQGQRRHGPGDCERKKRFVWKPRYSQQYGLSMIPNSGTVMSWNPNNFLEAHPTWRFWSDGGISQLSLLFFTMLSLGDGWGLASCTPVGWWLAFSDSNWSWFCFRRVGVCKPLWSGHNPKHYQISVDFVTRCRFFSRWRNLGDICRHLAKLLCHLQESQLRSKCVCKKKTWRAPKRTWKTCRASQKSWEILKAIRNQTVLENYELMSKSYNNEGKAETNTTHEITSHLKLKQNEPWHICSKNTSHLRDGKGLKNWRRSHTRLPAQAMVDQLKELVQGAMGLALWHWITSGPVKKIRPRHLPQEIDRNWRLVLFFKVGPSFIFGGMKHGKLKLQKAGSGAQEAAAPTQASFFSGSSLTKNRGCPAGLSRVVLPGGPGSGRAEWPSCFSGACRCGW